MSKGLQHKFYKTQKWRRCQSFVMTRANGLCEHCLRKTPPEYNAAEIVHHTVELNEVNINDDNITCNPDLLIAVCRKCHAEIHTGKRYKIDINGKVIV